MTILGTLNEAKPEEWDALNKLSKLCPTEDRAYEAPSIFNGKHKPETTPSRDRQVAGSHYKNSAHQPLEIVLHTEGYEAFKGACLTKVYKYLQRHKGERLEDFQKAQHILDWLVEETQNIRDEDDLYEKEKGFY